MINIWKALLLNKMPRLIDVALNSRRITSSLEMNNLKRYDWYAVMNFSNLFKLLKKI